MRRKILSLAVLALPYVITVLLPVVSVFYLTNLLIDHHHERAVTEKQRSFDIAFERFQKRMETIDNIVYAISTNQKVTSYAYGCLNGSDYNLIDYMEMSQLFANFMTNSDLSVVFLYDQSNNRIISNDTVISNAASYFGYYYQPLNQSIEEYMEYLSQLKWGSEYGAAEKAKVKGAEREVIEYRVSLPLGLTSAASQLVLVMEVEDILSDFYNYMDEGYEIYLYDSGDNLVYANGNQYEELLELEEISVMHQPDKTQELYGAVFHSDNGMWKVKVYMPGLSEYGNILSTPYYWLAVVAPVLISMMLSIYFTWKNHRKICEIINLFKGHIEPVERESVKNRPVSFMEIHEYADHIIKENKKYREQISDYEDAYKYKILDKLVRKTYEAEDEILKEIKQEKYDIVNGKCVVLCIQYENTSCQTAVIDDHTVRYIVKELLKEKIDRQFELFDTSEQETICILSVDQDDDETMLLLQDMIAVFTVEIVYDYGIEVRIAAGGIADSIYGLYDSYSQAKEVIAYNTASGRKIHLYSELPSTDDIFYFPWEFNDKIYNYIVVGKIEEARTLVRKIYEENFETARRKPSAKSIGIMKSQLETILESLGEKYDIPVEETIACLQEERNITDYFNKIYESVRQISEEIGNKKKTIQQNSMSKILAYINQNYHDSELSLKQISVTFGFHEKYISNLFKSVYGENLSTIIEKLRIEKACELLKNTDQKVNEIAEVTGYASDASFRRAFKKKVGVSPAEYRNG